MTAIGADLANLFNPPPPTEAFRQGEILTFNPATGANTVRVAGAVLADLPILVGGDTVNFEPGNAVILLKYGSSWAILGRVVVPGSDTLTAAAVGFGGASNSRVGGFSPTIVATDIQTVTVTVPLWANQALVLTLSTVTVNNNQGGDDVLIVSSIINGVGGGENFFLIPAGHFGAVTAHAHRSSMTVAPGGSFTIATRIRSGAVGWTDHGSNIANLDAIVVFRKA